MSLSPMYERNSLHFDICFLEQSTNLSIIGVLASTILVSLQVQVFLFHRLFGHANHQNQCLNTKAIGIKDLATRSLELAVRAVALAIGLSTITVGVVSPMIKLSTPVADVMFTNIDEWSHQTPDHCSEVSGCLTVVTDRQSRVSSHQTGDLTTKQGRRSHCMLLENVLPNFQR